MKAKGQLMADHVEFGKRSKERRDGQGDNEKMWIDSTRVNLTTAN
jgi:hypothetical protein